MLPNLFKRAFVQRAGLALCASLALAACGGGGGEPGTTIGTQREPTVKLDVVNSSGAAATTVSTTQSAVVRATVRNKSGAAVPNVLVTFSSNGLTFTPATATVVTDSSGTAAVSVLAMATTPVGGVEVSAASSVDTETVSGKIAITVVP